MSNALNTITQSPKLYHHHDPLVVEGVAAVVDVALSFLTLRALPMSPIVSFVSSQGTLLLVVFTGLTIPINVCLLLPQLFLLPPPTLLT